MARKTKTVTIESGRDEGKSFLITEMPVTKADKWANKALCNLLKAGVDISRQNVDLLLNTIDPSQNEKIDAMGGMIELARILCRAIGGIDSDVLQDLKDELFYDCVQVITSNGTARPFINVDDEIDGNTTMDFLRKEAFLLHIDFLAEGSSQT